MEVGVVFGVVQGCVLLCSLLTGLIMASGQCSQAAGVKRVEPSLIWTLLPGSYYCCLITAHVSKVGPPRSDLPCMSEVGPSGRSPLSWFLCCAGAAGCVSSQHAWTLGVSSAVANAVNHRLTGMGYCRNAPLRSCCCRPFGCRRVFGEFGFHVAKPMLSMFS